MSVVLPIDVPSVLDFDGLVSTIGQYLDREDFETIAPTFIYLAEAEMNRRLALNPVLPMMLQATGTISSEYMDVPSGLMDVVAFQYTDSAGNIWKLDYYSPENVARLLIDSDYYRGDGNQLFPGTTSDRQILAYTQYDTRFRFFPTPTESVSYQLNYWQRLPSLNEDTASNWLLADHPDVYLFGSLAHASAFEKDKENTAYFSQLFDSTLSGVLSAYPTRTDMTPLRTEISQRHIVRPNGWMLW